MDVSVRAGIGRGPSSATLAQAAYTHRTAPPSSQHHPRVVQARVQAPSGLVEALPGGEKQARSLRNATLKGCLGGGTAACVHARLSGPWWSGHPHALA